jgi:hypothetical protein
MDKINCKEENQHHQDGYLQRRKHNTNKMDICLYIIELGVFGFSCFLALCVCVCVCVCWAAKDLVPCNRGRENEKKDV